jgi:phosphoglycolate phosphatase
MDGYNYRLIIFDWDGTLSDSAAQIVSSMQRAVAALDLPPRADDDFRQMIGLSFEDGLGRVYPDHDTPTLIRLIQGYRRQWLGQMGEQGEPPLFAGALPALQALAAEGRTLAIATGKSRVGLQRSLQHHREVRRLMDATRTADETANKPHPLMLEELLDLFEVPASEALMVGDTEFDVVMAGALGMEAVGVTCGVHSPERLLAAGARALLPDVAALPKWLGSL